MPRRCPAGLVNIGPVITGQIVPGIVVVKSCIAYATGIMASDDQEVEEWYLEWWVSHLMAEVAHDSPGGKLEGESLTWEELAKDGGDYLEICSQVGVLKAFFSVR